MMYNRLIRNLVQPLYGIINFFRSVIVIDCNIVFVHLATLVILVVELGNCGAIAKLRLEFEFHFRNWLFATRMAKVVFKFNL